MADETKYSATTGAAVNSNTHYHFGQEIDAVDHDRKLSSIAYRGSDGSIIKHLLLLPIWKPLTYLSKDLEDLERNLDL